MNELVTDKPIQPRHKHTPIRTCVVCREREAKRTLTRVVRTPSGVLIDKTGKMDGRGAYLCDQRSCWERAVRTDILNKALRTVMTDEDRERLQQAIP